MLTPGAGRCLRLLTREGPPRIGLPGQLLSFRRFLTLRQDVLLFSCWHLPWLEPPGRALLLLWFQMGVGIVVFSN